VAPPLQFTADMKNKTAFYGLLFSLFVVAACSDSTPAREKFKTRELTPEEVQENGYDLPNKAKSAPTGEWSETEHFAAGGIVNAIAAMATPLVLRDNAQVDPVLIGHALPSGVKPFGVTGGKELKKYYEKKLESILGADLVIVHYMISYEHGATHKNKGKYLTNVYFTPKKIKVAPLWTLKAKTSSKDPINAGTDAKPVAQLGFSVNFAADGAVGSGERNATDSFTAVADTDELEAEIEDLED